MTPSLEKQTDEFLREGIEHVVPALRALRVFVDEVADGVRLALT